MTHFGVTFCLVKLKAHMHSLGSNRFEKFLHFIRSSCDFEKLLTNGYLDLSPQRIFVENYVKFKPLPVDFRSWESPQTLPALFIGPFEHVERFRNLKFSVKRITNIQSTVLSSSEGTAAIHLALK